jgi:biotin transport system substrate-specific component
MTGSQFSVLGSRFSASVPASRLSAIFVVGFAVALAAASQVAIPIPGTPVPFTLQPMIVVLAGLMLGPTLGAASMVLFLAVGAAGVPVFAPGGLPGVARFFGPTGGYLIAFPFAAYVAGFVSERTSSLTGRWLAAMAGMIVIFLGGLAQLTILTRGVGPAVAAGITPFALLDIVKAFLAALIARPRVRRAPY